MEKFDHLFSTNVAPHPFEVSSMKAEVAARRDAIRKLQLEIDCFNGALSPLRRVPVEILGEIFVIVVKAIELSNAMTIPLELVRLSLVCKLWREAALVTSRLWTRLGIEFTSPDYHAVDFKKVARWIARAGKLPLTLAFHTHHVPGQDFGGNPHHEGNCPLLNPGIAELLADGPDIASLSISCVSVQCLRWISDRVSSHKGTMPRTWDAIRTFAFQALFPGSHLHDLRDLEIRVFALIPTATTSLLVDTPFMGEHYREGIDATTRSHLSRLTSLSLTLFFPDQLAHTFLPLCSNLQSLTLKRDAHDEDVREFDPSSTVTLPRLRSLRIEGIMGDQFLPVAFRTAQLARLELKLLDSDYVTGAEEHEDIGEGIGNFVQLSGCAGTLVHFRLECLETTPTGFEAILKHLPSLTHLSLKEVMVATPFEDITDCHELLPRLEVFEWLGVEKGTRYDEVCHYVVGWLGPFYPTQTHPYLRQLKKFTMEIKPETQIWADPYENRFVKSLMSLGVDTRIAVNLDQIHPSRL
ncbi:hypothetical protein NMY22_g14540 [Coprinellus aureogranulatus]|nr:hypothetical protein NMY22_g14540 [Coprinellus aureogranulatus]